MAANELAYQKWYNVVHRGGDSDHRVASEKERSSILEKIGSVSMKPNSVAPGGSFNTWRLEQFHIGKTMERNGHNPWVDTRSHVVYDNTVPYVLYELLAKPAAQSQFILRVSETVSLGMPVKEGVEPTCFRYQRFYIETNCRFRLLAQDGSGTRFISNPWTSIQGAATSLKALLQLFMVEYPNNEEAKTLAQLSEGALLEEVVASIAELLSMTGPAASLQSVILNNHKRLGGLRLQISGSSLCEIYPHSVTQMSVEKLASHFGVPPNSMVEIERFKCEMIEKAFPKMDKFDIAHLVGDGIIAAYTCAWGRQSCMSGHIAKSTCAIYAQNPLRISLIVGKVKGDATDPGFRVLLWKCDNGSYMLDRVHSNAAYPVSTILNVIQAYVKKVFGTEAIVGYYANGGTVNYTSLTCTIHLPAEHGMAYFDTFPLWYAPKHHGIAVVGQEPRSVLLVGGSTEAQLKTIRESAKLAGINTPIGALPASHAHQTGLRQITDAERKNTHINMPKYSIEDLQRISNEWVEKYKDGPLFQEARLFDPPIPIEEESIDDIWNLRATLHPSMQTYTITDLVEVGQQANNQPAVVAEVLENVMNEYQVLPPLREYMYLPVPEMDEVIEF